MSRGPSVISAGLVCVVLTSCSATGSSHPSAPTIEITMREFSFDYTAPHALGRMVFHMVNAGHLDHRLALVPLAADFPEITSQLRGTRRRFITEQASIPDRPPGAEGIFAADLTRGRYAFICFTVDPDGVSHGAKGMASEFKIG